MEFILVVAALVGLFWLSVISLRAGLIGTALVVLLAGSCFGHPFFNAPLGSFPITLDRLLLVLMLAQYLVCRNWSAIDPKPLSKPDYFLGAFLAVLIVSTFANDFRFQRGLPVSQLVFFYLMPAAIYWVVRQTQWNARSAWWMFASLTVFGLYLCLTAVAETKQIWSVVFPRYIGSSIYPEFLGRGRGPYLNPAANGMVMGLCFCAALMWWPRVSRGWKLAMVAGLLPVFAVGIFATMTRSVWMGAGAALVIIVALSAPRNWRAAVLGAAGLAAVLVLVVGGEHLVAFKRDKDVSAEAVADSVKLRPILATVAWHMFLDHPVLGVGFGQYIQASPYYLADRTTDLPLERARPFIQHNVFLGVLTETGAVGLGLFLATLSSWTWVAWRLWRQANAPLWVRQIGLMFLGFMGVYVCNGMFHNMAVIPQVNMVLFFMGGTIVGLSPWMRCEPNVAPPRVWSADLDMIFGLPRTQRSGATIK